MKYRYYTNDAGDIMSGFFRDDLSFSEDENAFVDDPDMHSVSVLSRESPFVAGYWTAVCNLIYFGLLNNDEALTRHLLKVGAFQ